MTSVFKSSRVLLVGGCGYIGSYLYQKFVEAGVTPIICDHLARGNPLMLPVIEKKYSELSAADLSEFNVVVWFAGHSSVGQSVLDPEGALSNNCFELFGFAKKLFPGTKLIYASSGSLYSKPVGGVLSPACETDLVHIPYQNPYDISKFAFDYLAEHFLTNFYGLRMGTLSGFSPNLRGELLFNSMSISAISTGKVVLKNRNAFRTILFLDDLWMLIKNLLLTDAMPGFYNAGSMSGTIGDFALSIASTLGAQVDDQGESETYSFLLDTTRMDQLLSRANEKLTIEQRVNEFIADYRQHVVL